jgi:hypothetical protein
MCIDGASRRLPGYPPRRQGKPKRTWGDGAEGAVGGGWRGAGEKGAEGSTAVSSIDRGDNSRGNGKK